MLIPRRWYKTEKQLEDMSILCQQPFTNGFQESSEETVYTETYIELPYKVANISYKRIHKSLNQRKKYVTANGLSKKAIQMGLDAGPFAIQEFNNIMKNYIVRYTLKHNQEVTRRNLRTLLDNTYNSFWKAIEREWNSIDSHRATFTRSFRDDWNKLNEFVKILDGVLLNLKISDGVKYHLCDVYVDELAFIGTLAKWKIPIAQLLHPFFSLFTRCQNKHLINKISEDVLAKTLTVIPIGEVACHVEPELTKIVNRMIKMISDDNISSTCRNQAKINAQKYLQTITEITDKLSDNNVAEGMNEVSRSYSETRYLRDMSSETLRINRSSKSISWGINVTREYVKDSTVPANTLAAPSTPPRGILKRRYDHEENADYEICRLSNLTLSIPAKKFREK
ncbi:12317_t:CDS:2 [Gigaspora rosea]|nr:12317_t:CDS:2 [Gigaspora rosea]